MQKVNLKIVHHSENVEQKMRHLLMKHNIVAPQKYLSNFWRSLGMLLINCKVELSLS